MLLVQAGCLVLLAQIVLCFPPKQEKTTYAGHKVYEVYHTTEDDYRKLKELELKLALDVWKGPKHVNDSMTVRVPPEHIVNFIKELKDIDAKFNTLIEDMEDFMQEIEEQNNNHRRRQIFNPGSGFNHDIYNDYTTIMNFLKTVEADGDKSTGVTATTQVIGYSTEGREITLIKISSSSGGTKRGIFIDGAIHAREWVSPAAVCFLIEEFAYNPDNIADIYTLLTMYDLYLLPVLNPDGYQFSRDSTRLWRKNRRVNDNSNCRGVDLNRNFPFQWNPATGGSTDPCQDTYSGVGAASEAETQVLVNYLRTNAALFDAYITVHSYGQYWLYPWGYTTAYPTDRVDLEFVGRKAAKRIRRLTGSRYTVGSAARVLYAAAGGSDDFAKGDAGIKYSYTLELRDTGRYGFLLPESEIRPTCEELREGFLAFAFAMNARQQQGI